MRKGVHRIRTCPQGWLLTLRMRKLAHDSGAPWQVQQAVIAARAHLPRLGHVSLPHFQRGPRLPDKLILALCRTTHSTSAPDRGHSALVMQPAGLLISCCCTSSLPRPAYILIRTATRERARMAYTV